MLTTILVGAAFAAALYFPVMLRARSQWNANAPIRALMFFSCIIVAVVGLSLLRQLGWVPPEWVRAAIYGSILLGLLVQDVTLTNTQNRRAARISRERREVQESLMEKETQT